MPLEIVRAPDTRTLWDTFAGRFLDQIGDRPGPGGLPAHAWLAQESQVDLLYEAAVARGLKGWLGPPVTTLRGLPGRFELRVHRVGLLTRRRLIARIASRVARDVGMRDPSRGDGVVRGHMLDALFGELLPEGVAPERLEAALGALPGDAFSRRRNRWIAGSYAGYLEELRRRDQVDARQASALIAARIDAGGLTEALRGASVLHLYGLYMPRSRHRLLEALQSQTDVDVRLYLLASAREDPETSEWEELDAAIEELSGVLDPAIQVQPAPDTRRETEWVARQVKRALLEERLEPHRVAVVARSGHEDTGRFHRALRDAGVVATSIVRARLTEISALKALLSLFRGAAAGWTYRTLRPVLDNALFDIPVDTRTLDFIAHQRRVEGLQAWEAEIEQLLARLRDTDERGRPRHRSVWGSRLRAESVAEDLEAFRGLRAALDLLGQARPEEAWIDLTLALLRDEHPAAFHLRRRLCEPAGKGDAEERWDVVRLDQRGVRQCEVLLREWRDLDHGDEPLDAEEWSHLLQRMLEANELSITTPVHKGVQVLEAHDAALSPFARVFVVHANDGVFPRATPSGGVLSSEERARLREAGIPLGQRELDLHRERALWRAVTSAGAVTVTYRTADPTGTPLLPSLLVPEHDPDLELPRTRTGARARERATAVDATPVTAAQADRRAALALRDRVTGPDLGTGAPPELYPGNPELLPHAIVGAVAESMRDTGAEPLEPGHPGLHPNPWNGWLRDPRVQAWLVRKFGEDYRWSASALEAYSRLPFQFLLDRVLRYEEAVEADEEVTPLVFGATAHDLLERFYARLLEDLPASFDDRAERAFAAAAREVIDAAEARGDWLGARVLWEQEWKGLLERVRHYLVWELGYLAETGQRPERIEYAFGFDDDERVVVSGKDVWGHPAVLRLCGRIDRVDRAADGYRVLDYKSNNTPSKNAYLDGTTLQAPLYMQVLEDEGLSVVSGYYRALKAFNDKPNPIHGGEIKRGEDKYGEALRFALSIPRRIREGLFEPVLSVRAGNKWPFYAAGRDVARSAAVLEDGDRYHHLEPLQPDPAPPGDGGSGAAADARRGDGDRAPQEPPDRPPRLPFGEGSDG